MKRHTPQPASTFQPYTEGLWQLPESIYRTAPGINNSELKHIRRSPAHYMAEKAKDREQTASQLFGTLLHAMVLEPEAVDYVVRPAGIDYRTKDGKAWRQEQTSPIIDADEADALKSCAAAVQQHPLVARMLENAWTEVAVFSKWKGLLLKGKVDIIGKDSEGRTFIADLKTTEDASPAEFPYSARRWNYIRQPAYYADLVGADKFYFIAVEKSAPFAVCVYEVDEPTMARSRMLYEEDLEVLLRCLDTNRWPAYGTGAFNLSLI